MGKGRLLYSVSTKMLLILVLMFFTATGLEARSKKVCKPGLLGGKYHYHSGDGDVKKSKSRAKRSAAASWSAFTNWEYGKSWANIRNAIRISYKCTKSSKRSWQCSVDAVPCAWIKR